jgi:large subunit ribosomal protein L10
LKREQKAQVIDEIAAQISEAEAIYAVDYRGLTVTQAASLRESLREAGARFRIVKNTLTLRAADQAGAEQVKDLIEGPTAFTFVTGDPALAAKALDAFYRREQVLDVRGGIVGGQLLDADTIKRLARLPGRDQLNAQLAGIVASPLTGLVRGIGSLLSGLAIALGQVRDIKETALPAHETLGGGEAASNSEESEAPAEEEPKEEAPAEEAPDEEQPQAEAAAEEEVFEDQKEAE